MGKRKIISEKERLVPPCLSIILITPRGTVKRWFAYRGCGFIAPDDESDDVFVHVSDVEEVTGLKEGEKVEFEVESTYNGSRAVNVKPVSE